MKKWNKKKKRKSTIQVIYFTFYFLNSVVSSSFFHSISNFHGFHHHTLVSIGLGSVFASVQITNTVLIIKSKTNLISVYYLIKGKFNAGIQKLNCQTLIKKWFVFFSFFFFCCHLEMFIWFVFFFKINVNLFV